MTPLLVAGNEKLNVVMNIDVRAECKGFDAVLTTSDGETQTISYDGFGVQNTSETAVTVILLNGNNGEVIAASQVKASDYNRDLTDVKSIDVRELPTIKSYEDGISVCSQSEAYVRIFTVDGRMHYSGRIEAGESFIEVKEKGLVVVDVDGSFFKILK